MSSSSADSLDILPATIFLFLDRGEINIAMWEDEPNLYIVMFSNRSLPFVVSSTLGQARRCGSTVSHHDHHNEASRSLSNDSEDSLDMGSPE